MNKEASKERLATLAEYRTALEKSWLICVSYLVKQDFDVDEATEAARNEAAAFLDDLVKRM